MTIEVLKVNERGVPSNLTQSVAGSVPICSILFPRVSLTPLGIVTGIGTSHALLVVAYTVNPVILALVLLPPDTDEVVNCM